jgi:hypothetical protein
MSTVLDPIVSEFQTEEQAVEYDRWFRNKVEQSLAQADDSLSPHFSTDEVSQRMEVIIQAAEAKHAASQLAS